MKYFVCRSYSGQKYEVVTTADGDHVIEPAAEARERCFPRASEDDSGIGPVSIIERTGRVVHVAGVVCGEFTNPDEAWSLVDWLTMVGEVQDS